MKPEPPTSTALRRQLAELHPRQQKLVGGMITVMLRNANRIHEREWITEQFTQLALLVTESELAEDPVQAAQDTQEFAQANINPVLNASFALFLRVRADLSEQDPKPPGFDDAVARALSYFADE